MQRVLIILALALLGFPTSVQNADAGEVWRVLEVKGDVRAGTAIVTRGTELGGDVTIETGSDGSVTLVHSGERLSIGPNARVHLPIAGAQPDILKGQAEVQRNAGAQSEMLRGATTAEISTPAADSTPVIYTSRASAPYTSAAQAPAAHTEATAPAPDVPPVAFRRGASAAAAPRTAMTSAAPTTTSLPSVRGAYQDHSVGRGLGSATTGSMGRDTPRSVSAGAPALRATRLDDTDVQAASGRSGFELDAGSSSAAGLHRSMEQQVGSAAAAFSQASRQNIAIDRQAAEQLLHKVKPQFENSGEADGAQAVMGKAAGVMAVVIVLQLLSMGLLALWRYTRNPKAAQAQPRWRSL